MAVVTSLAASGGSVLPLFTCQAPRDLQRFSSVWIIVASSGAPFLSAHHLRRSRPTFFFSFFDVTRTISPV